MIDFPTDRGRHSRPPWTAEKGHNGGDSSCSLRTQTPTEKVTRVIVLSPHVLKEKLMCIDMFLPRVHAGA
jgi:hypothetical protein